MKINNLRVWNFRSIGSGNVEKGIENPFNPLQQVFGSNKEESGIDIQLKPLTIFVGPNGSGKSSILYAILWMKLKKGYSMNNMSGMLDEEKNIFGVQSYEDLAFGRNSQNWIGVEQTFNIDFTDEIKHFIEKIDWKSLEIPKPESSEFTYGFRIRRNEKNTMDYQLNFKFGDLELKFQCVYEPYKERYIWTFETSFTETVQNYGELSYNLLSGFYLHSRLQQGGLDKKLGEKKMEEIKKVDKLVELLLERLKTEIDKKLIYIGPTRGYVRFSDTPATTQNVGYRGEDLLKGLAYAYLNADPDVRRELSNMLTKWAEKFGIEDLNAGLDVNRLVAMYRDVEKLNLGSASYGERQLITFLTQLIISPPGSVILIEEPEISLHPESQAILPLLFADVIKKHDKQIIITTHSTILPLAISDAVSGEGFSGIKLEEKLDVNDIALYHVTRDNYCTQAEKIELTEEGYPKYIPSFAKVEAELFDRLSKRVIK